MGPHELCKYQKCGRIGREGIHEDITLGLQTKESMGGSGGKKDWRVSVWGWREEWVQRVQRPSEVYTHILGTQRIRKPQDRGVGCFMVPGEPGEIWEAFHSILSRVLVYLEKKGDRSLKYLRWHALLCIVKRWLSGVGETNKQNTGGIVSRCRGSELLHKFREKVEGALDWGSGKGRMVDMVDRLVMD